MKKEIFETAFIEKLNSNYQKRSKYFEFEFQIFHELGGPVFEINKCLILEFYRAAITLTNNTLERLLKLALINNEVGIQPIPLETWNDVFREPHQKYNSLNFGSSIEACKKNGLITEDEKTFLFDIVRNQIRNGFSHADGSKILIDFPEEVTLFQGTFSNPNDLKPVRANQKIIPFLEAIQVENFAKENAEPYFNYVFDLIGNIEIRINQKH